MPQYDIVQMHQAGDSSHLQFPRVPVQAVVSSVDERNVPIGIPATVAVLTAITSTPVAPSSIGEQYYNNSTCKVHTAVPSGAALVWNAGAPPVDGVLYRGREAGETSDTLYVKSISSGSACLTKLTVPNYSSTYDGAFAVEYLTSANNACTCTVRDLNTGGIVGNSAGKVFMGWNAYDVPASSGITVSDGATMYLVGTELSEGLAFDITTDPYVSGTMRTRLAANRGGRMIQIQRSDVVMAQGTVVVSTHVPTVKYAAPTISANIPNTTMTYGPVVLTAVYDAAIVTKLYSTNQTSWSPYPSGGVSNTTNRTVYFKGEDEVGDYTATGSYTITNIDRTAPNVDMEFTPATWTNGNVRLVAHIDGDAEGYGYKLIDPAQDTGTYWGEYDNFEAQTISGGKIHASTTITSNTNVHIVAQDSAGNLNMYLRTVGWIDRTNPTIASCYLASSGTTTPVQVGSMYVGATVVCSATKPTGTAPISSYWFRLGGDATANTGWSSNTTGKYNITQNGTYYVRAYDSAGNYATASCVVTQVNNTVPAKPTVTHSPTSKTNQNVDITAISDSTAVKIWYREGTTGSYVSQNGSSCTINVAHNGTWYFYATNNVATSSPVESHTVNNIDKSPPTITLTDWDNTHTLAETYITATTEAGLTIHWHWKEPGSNVWSEEYTYTTQLLIGDNGTYEFYAEDAAHNVGSASVTFNNLVTDSGRD